MGYPRVLALSAAVAAALSAAGVQPALGAHPGVNGSIAFTDPNQGLFVMGPGGENRTVVSGDRDDQLPTFSPDGSKIVFVNTDFPIAPGELEEFPAGVPGADGLYVMDANGENRTRVLNPAGNPLGDPVFSPDGSRIAFTRDVREEGPDALELHVINVDGSNERVLTRPRQVAGTTEYDTNPAWSPDGSRIAVERKSTGARSGIWAIGADGLGETQLTSQAANPGLAEDSDPDWSPDGSKIVFRGEVSGGNGDIHVIDAGGANRTRLTDSPLDEKDPTFAPDGSLIAFNRVDLPQGGADEGAGEVWVMGANGAAPRNLTNTPESIEEVPAWQPRPRAGTLAGDRKPPVISNVAVVPSRFVVAARPTPLDGVAAQRRRRRGATIRYRLSEIASAKLQVERLGRGIRVTRLRRTRCVRLTARTRAEALAQIRRRLGARARGPTGRRRVARALRRARCTAARPAGRLVRRSKRGLNRVTFTGRIGREKLAPGSYRIRVGAIDAAANLARPRYSRPFKVVR
jgi:Tol biopolymer transport system component